MTKSLRFTRLLICKCLIEYLHDPTWKKLLGAEFEKPYMKELEESLEKEYESKTIYPKPENIFSAFNLTSFLKIKVVIIGQDPYHGPIKHTACVSLFKKV